MKTVIKSALKPVLITSFLLAAMVTAPLVFSHGKHEEGAPLVPSSDNNAQHMSQMMNDAHDSIDTNKRHEMMQEHMGRMQSMMGSMENMMGDNMPDNMSVEQRQDMISRHMDVMHGTMEEIMKQLSAMMNSEK